MMRDLEETSRNVCRVVLAQACLIGYGVLWVSLFCVMFWLLR